MNSSNPCRFPTCKNEAKRGRKFCGLHTNSDSASNPLTPAAQQPESPQTAASRVAVMPQAQEPAAVFSMAGVHLLQTLQVENVRLTQENRRMNQLEADRLRFEQASRDAWEEVTRLKEVNDELRAENVRLHGRVIQLEKHLKKVDEETERLQSEVKETKASYVSVSERLAVTVTELKDTRSTVERLQRMEVFAGVGSWIEFARFQILKELGTDGLTTQNQAQKWHELCLKSKNDLNYRNLVNKTIKKLFGLEAYEWIMISVEFYKKTRNTAFHERPPLLEVLELLDSLPPPFDSRKDVFKTLITNAATMEPESNDDCF